MPEPPAPGAGGPGAGSQPGAAARKLTVSELGIDVAAQNWQRSGGGDGSVEIAFAGGTGPRDALWVLMRVAGDAGGRVLVYDRHEWECFLDGVRNGEFDTEAG